LGVIVSRAGQTAVARNRLRRRLREIARRRLLPSLLPIDLVIRTKPDAYRASFDELAAELEQWLVAFAESQMGPDA
jgi:ribonuclease P protein component